MFEKKDFLTIIIIFLSPNILLRIQRYTVFGGKGALSRATTETVWNTGILRRTIMPMTRLDKNGAGDGELRQMTSGFG